jgi:hypothetical protein
MGNYSGTIRCGHCYERGHNRAGCPKLTEEIATRFERLHKAVKEGRRAEDDYTFVRTRERLAKRTGVDPVTGESKRKRRATYGGRKCSYCGEPGHTRRTCPSMKADKESYRTLTAASRSVLIGRMREQGFGPGSLLTTVSKDWIDGEYKTRTIPMIVKSVDWTAIHQKTWGIEGQGGPECVTVLRMSDNRMVNISLPNCVTGNDSMYSKVELAGRVSEVQPPAGWLDASDLDSKTMGKTVDLFETGESRDYYWWRRQEERQEMQS